MATHEITVSRSAYHTLILQVEAESAEEAEAKVNALMGKAQWRYIVALAPPEYLAAISADALRAELFAGVAPGSIGAMNWAAWENKQAVARRKLAWRKAAGSKVQGSHIVIYDTNQPTRAKSCWHEYGGPMNLTACEIEYKFTHSAGVLNAISAKLQAAMNTRMAALMEHYEQAESRLWRTHYEAEQLTPQFYERAGRWQSNLTDFVPSLSGTSLPEPGRSRSDGNKSKRGWLSRMPSASMACAPMPRTRRTRNRVP
jgi:hypothetical protein